MKLGIEDTLQQIDTAFKQKKQQEVYITYFMIFALIFAVSYMFFWESSFNDFKNREKTIKNLDKSIKESQKYLRENPMRKVALLKNDIKKAKKELLVYIDNNDYIKSQIEDISELIYDEKAWGKYLNSISKNAQKYHISIINFTNKYAMSNQAFGHILDIHLEFIADYKHTILFINSLEESNLVVDIHKFDMIAEDKLSTSLDISVWGITE